MMKIFFRCVWKTKKTRLNLTLGFVFLGFLGLSLDQAQAETWRDSLAFKALTKNILYFYKFPGVPRSSRKIGSNKTQCTDSQVLIYQEEPDPTQRDLFKDILFQITRTDCIEKEIFNKLRGANTQLAKIIIEHAWAASAEEIIQLAIYMQTLQPSWKEETRVLKGPVLKRVHLRTRQDSTQARMYVKPNGNVVLHFKNKKIGKGTYKQVFERFEFVFNDEGLIQSFLPIVELAFSSKKAYDLERRNYLILAESNVLHPDRPAKIPRTEFLRVMDVAGSLNHGNGMLTAIGYRYVMLQDLYLGDLENMGHHRWLMEKEDQRLSTLIQIAEALGDLHARKDLFGKEFFVHGDFKEANLMVTTAGEILISDLGLSYNPIDFVRPRTTADYEAPEMVQEAPLYDPLLEILLANEPQSEIVEPSSSTSSSVALFLPGDERPVSYYQKRDVWGYGVILANALEQPHAQGKKGIRSNLLPYWVCKTFYFSEGATIEYKDCALAAAKSLQKHWREKAAVSCADGHLPCLEEIAAKIFEVDPNLRPSMSEVVQMLKTKPTPALTNASTDQLVY